MEAALHRPFIKKFKKVPKQIRAHFVERKNLFLAEPFHPLLHNHSVDKAFPGCRSINIAGDYRAIFIQKEEVVVFVDIGTHAELY